MNSKTRIIRSLDMKQLAAYITRQVNHFFPDPNPLDEERMLSYLQHADERILACFGGVHKKYFNHQGCITINHLHSDQYCMYLNMMARHSFKEEEDEMTATKLYYLNKALHAVDIYYTVELPESFLFVHPVGSVLGPAKFGGFFVMYQNCLVGCLNDQVFPQFEGRTILYAGATVLGHCNIGDNCIFAAHSHTVNEKIKSNTVVIGGVPNIRMIANSTDFFQRPPFVYA